MLMTTIEVQKKLRVPPLGRMCPGTLHIRRGLQIMFGSTYNGLVRPSEWLIDKISIMDVNWFERMSKKEITFIKRLVLRFI